MNKGIFWLASYPKSGNTWFRSFLRNLQEDGDKPVSINDLGTGHRIASAREWINETVSFDIADLYPEETNALRPKAYEWSAMQDDAFRYHKIHDACLQLENGEWLVSAKATAGALYFIRNPLDVAISYANHLDCSIDKAIKNMSDSKHGFCKNQLNSLKNQLEQRLLSWSEHITSWVDNPVIDCFTIRYEDMKHKPQTTFTAAAAYLQLPTDPLRIEKALRFSDFKELQDQEDREKFNERPPDINRFFRKGIAGDWQNTLTNKQIDRIINDHHIMMQRFGYLDDAGNPQVM